MEQGNKCSHPPCNRTDTKRSAWTVSGLEWFHCPEHEREVGMIVAKNHCNRDKESAIFRNRELEKEGLTESLLEIHNRGEHKKTGLFDF